MKLGIKRNCCPLTLEELRNMNGKPVWVKCCNPQKYISPPIGWRILEKSVTGNFGVWDGESCLPERDYGTDWFAYAYEPIKIDRSKWEPCHYCEDVIYSDFAHDYAMGEDTGNYCKYCGRPITEQAWEELEKKVCGEWLA